jgi:methylamine methyltransferase corrinoid protein reductive activase
MQFGIALDLGTSGFRGQLVDLDKQEVLGTVITARHPLPGANVIDHLNFAIEVGVQGVHEIILNTINQMIEHLPVPRENITRLAVCGNPIQLSLFENIEIRDLAYAGENKKKLLGIKAPDRSGKIISGKHLPLLRLPEDAIVLIPPAVKHEIGADALAMLVLSGVLEREETALVTDYGTNAEMALKVGDRIISGSCAAGPALEGQHIKQGMLAAPGAICDINKEKNGYRSFVLDANLQAEPGDLVTLEKGLIIENGLGKATGITGTGVIAAVAQGFESGLIKLPRIDTINSTLSLASNVIINEKDLEEAGKAFGALRAGYITLAAEAGIEIEDIKVAYMAGASGTYVDPIKARKIGIVPPVVEKIYQIGNTSLAMARELVINPNRLEELKEIAGKLLASHCMFGDSKVFERAYLLELSYWGEGMPWSQYRKFASMYKLPALPDIGPHPQLIKKSARDITQIGVNGLVTIQQVGEEKRIVFPGCNGCSVCIIQCPEKALKLEEVYDTKIIKIRLDRCNGTACKRCETICRERCFNLMKISLHN